MSYIAAMVIIIFIITLLPDKVVITTSKALINLKKKFYKKSLVLRGEELYTWLGSSRLNSVGFDLDRSLPSAEIYKSFGVELHFLWDQVQKYGGGLGPSISALKKTLARDLKFEKSKHNFLKSSYIQIVCMLLLTWTYFCAYIILEISKLDIKLLLGILIWQFLGVLIFYGLLRRIEENTFKASKFFLGHIIKLKIFSNAHMNLSELENPSYFDKLDLHEDILYHKICGVFEQGRSAGRCSEATISELEDDYIFTLEQRVEYFLGFLKRLSFIWSVIFILPCLFVTTFHSISQLL